MLSSASPRVQLIQSYFDVITLSLGPVGDGADVILDDLDSVDNLFLSDRSFYLGNRRALDVVSVMVGVNVDRVQILGDVGLADHLLHGIEEVVATFLDQPDTVRRFHDADLGTMYYHLRSTLSGHKLRSQIWTETLRCQEDLMRRQSTEMV